MARDETDEAFSLTLLELVPDFERPANLLSDGFPEIPLDFSFTFLSIALPSSRSIIPRIQPPRRS